MWITKRSRKEGHGVVFQRVVTDEKDAIVQTLSECIETREPHAVLMTGGTGISDADFS